MQLQRNVLPAALEQVLTNSYFNKMRNFDKRKHIFLGLILSFLASNSVSALQLPLFVAEYASIVMANKSFLDFQLAEKSSRAEVGVKAYSFCALADACRLIEKLYLLDKNNSIASRQQFGGSRSNFNCQLGVVYEAGEKYDLFWIAFDFISMVYHLKKRSALSHEVRKKKMDEYLNAIDSDSAWDERVDEKAPQDVENYDLVAGDDGNVDDIETPEIEDVNQTKIIIMKTLAIYVLPLCEVGCAYACSNSTSDTTYAGSAFRAKFQAIQSMIRLVSEILMCEKNSKMCWVYAGFILVAAAALWHDLGIVSRGLAEEARLAELASAAKAELERKKAEKADKAEKRKRQEAQTALERERQERKREKRERQRKEDLERKRLEKEGLERKIIQLKQSISEQELMKIEKIYYDESPSESVCFCYDTTRDESASWSVLKCGHAFHMSCFDAWRSKQTGPTSCPTCSRPLSDAGELRDIGLVTIQKVMAAKKETASKPPQSASALPRDPEFDKLERLLAQETEKLKKIDCELKKPEGPAPAPAPAPAEPPYYRGSYQGRPFNNGSGSFSPFPPYGQSAQHPFWSGDHPVRRAHPADSFRGDPFGQRFSGPATNQFQHGRQNRGTGDWKSGNWWTQHP